MNPRKESGEHHSFIYPSIQKRFLFNVYLFLRERGWVGREGQREKDTHRESEAGSRL